MESNSSDSKNSGTNNLFELIQNLQNKLSNENIPNENKIQETNDFNNNYEKNIVNNSNNSGGGLDFSSIASILGNLNLSGILGNNNNNNQVNNQKNVEPESDSPNIDINTIMKMQKLVSSMNRSDPRKNLLLSLKPFLRKSRQDKINEYITILSVTSALGIFGNKGGD